MKSSQYWRERFLQQQTNQLSKGIEYYLELEKQYRMAKGSVEKDINNWYARFAKNNEISMAEAKRVLRTKELEEFKWSVDEYIDYGQRNSINQLWMKKLENASARVHISRLDSLQLQIQHQIEILYGNQLDHIDRLARDIYTDTYYHTAFEIQQGFNIGWGVRSINNDKLNTIINKPWANDGVNFSKRLWGNKSQLIDTLHTQLTQSVIRGDGPQKVISSIAKKMDSSRKAAGRLVMTESAFFSSASQGRCFKDLNVEHYEIIATLDLDTSEICRDLDGKVLKMKNYKPGITAPPFHPWCRTVTAPYFDDDYSERIARDLDGKTYYVPSNMKYKEWYDKCVVDKYGKSKLDFIKKVIKNKDLDRSQFEKYSVIFNKDFPYTLEEFQNLKYNNSIKWKYFKDKKQELLNSLDYKDSFFAKFGDYEVRSWYITHDNNIPKIIDRNKSLEWQARKAHSLRNRYRTEARQMMRNQTYRKELDATRPNISFDDLVADKMNRKGLSREDAIKDTLNTATKTNKKVNSSLGLED